MAARAKGLFAAALSALLLLGLFAAPASAAPEILAARVWPAPDYTRITLETRAELKYELFSLKDPERLVLDLHGVGASGALAELQERIAEDPTSRSCGSRATVRAWCASCST